MMDVLLLSAVRCPFNAGTYLIQQEPFRFSEADFKGSKDAHTKRKVSYYGYCKEGKKGPLFGWTQLRTLGKKCIGLRCWNEID